MHDSRSLTQHNPDPFLSFLNFPLACVQTYTCVYVTYAQINILYVRVYVSIQVRNAQEGKFSVCTHVRSLHILFSLSQFFFSFR